MSVVYFFSDGGRAIKIGTSKAVGTRLREVQKHSADEIEFLGSTPGTFRHEAEIHRRLAAFRLRGEWFADCTAVRELMVSVLRDGTANMEFSRRYRGPSSPDALVLDCQRLCGELIRRAKAEGRSTAEAIESVSELTGIGHNRIWKFKYRPPGTVRAEELSSLRRAALVDPHD